MTSDIVESPPTTINENVSNNEKIKIVNNLTIGIIDYGEKDYLTRCIHEGITPELHRIHTIKMYIICYDKDLNDVEYILQPANNISTTKEIDNKETERIEEKSDNVIVGVQLESNDESNLTPKNRDYTKIDTAKNEKSYDLSIVPDSIDYIVIYLNIDDYDKNEKLGLYLIDNSEIYFDFYIPDLFNNNNNDSNKIQLIACMKRCKDGWEHYKSK